MIEGENRWFYQSNIDGGDLTELRVLLHFILPLITGALGATIAGAAAAAGDKHSFQLISIQSNPIQPVLSIKYLTINWFTFSKPIFNHLQTLI